ncbi:MAG: EscU/YscU/HrcU family type III secretion system export apparatus switch protein [Candidatus Elarobacter sp.]
MSDTADKRFDPTPSRRERAKREGNSARSSELCSLASFGAAVLAATVAVPLGAGALETVLHAGAMAPGVTAPGALAGAALAALMPAVAAACAGSAVALGQAGGLHVAGLKLDPTRLDPVAGLKRMAGADAAVGMLRALLAFGASVAAMIPIIGDAVAAGATLASPRAAAALVGATALRACGAALGAAALFAVADYALARRRWLRGLKMSHDELKRDAKDNEGDPQARSRRTAAHRAIVRGAIGRTREASFVVVNPTHVAVALRYAPPEVPVPQILVRARDAAALRVRVIARECGIPVLENVALARLLYAHGENGRAIPPEGYVAVAQIIASLARAGVLA